ncbi:UDP-N-acetylglucosamine 3-dehydrogenase [Candidatus Velamenicoccus archaeovorus]|uniref:UDP-N-acetylglucosamine 3-dehydrogenase n=1 Tax=Velamenicoccus archaeovorus TaxID=1930593 RepID=A0A410P2R9_VELA1|nr:Gfo/Idh/MocA family oxidoreductase [Candidatus Velamenicoccus archaeovorus]QAT16378.1 UDP-N-acetylglucosamine 3-dehydrogenase [Candidatus Velamenicoccus archaeovorus]
MPHELKVAVIGCGRLGSIHTRVYTEIPYIRLVGVCDIDAVRAEQLAQTHHTQAFTDYKTLIPQADIVSIATPTSTHFEVAKFAIAHKKHVLIEKPITNDLRQARKLIRLARRFRVILQVGHVERFNSAFIAAQKIVHQPRFIECHRLSPFPNRSLDIGVVFDLMIHDIDIILGLIQSKITHIDAVGVNVLTPFEDIANVRLHFRNGCIVNLTASRISDEVMRKIRIFLKDTYISLDYQVQEAFVYKKENHSITKTAIPIEKEEPIKKEIESFTVCVRNHRQPVVSGIEAYEALRLATKITRIIRHRAAKIV